MTDRDRGTYSPPTEDSLSYETRRPAGRDQAPITLIISGIFLVLLLLAVVMFYNSGLNHGRTAPEVGDSVGDIKDAPVQEAKPLTDQDLNTPLSDDSASAHFAPGTEAPLRDNSASQGVTTEAPPPAKPITGPLPSQSDNAAITGQGTPAATPAPLKPAVQTVTPATTGTAASASATSKSVAAPKPADTPAKADKTSTTDATPASAKGGSIVQIGAFDSTETANKQYASVASSYGLFLAGTSKRIEKVDTPKGTFYRTSFAGFSTPDKARSFCSALKAAGRDCIVK
ncbi:MAG: SPOR domain-containing protein [Asticcacaulis sp.]|nr:SPOR domain-containing protein [Asticcacaulis sp.]